MLFLTKKKFHSAVDEKVAYFLNLQKIRNQKQLAIQQELKDEIAELNDKIIQLENTLSDLEDKLNMHYFPELSYTVHTPSTVACNSIDTNTKYFK